MPRYRPTPPIPRPKLSSFLRGVARGGGQGGGGARGGGGGGASASRPPPPPPPDQTARLATVLPVLLASKALADPVDLCELVCTFCALSVLTRAFWAKADAQPGSQRAFFQPVEDEDEGDNGDKAAATRDAAGRPKKRVFITNTSKMAPEDAAALDAAVPRSLLGITLHARDAALPTPPAPAAVCACCLRPSATAFAFPFFRGPLLPLCFPCYANAAKPRPFKSAGDSHSARAHFRLASVSALSCGYGISGGLPAAAVSRSVSFARGSHGGCVLLGHAPHASVRRAAALALLAFTPGELRRRRAMLLALGRWPLGGGGTKKTRREAGAAKREEGVVVVGLRPLRRRSGNQIKR